MVSSILVQNYIIWHRIKYPHISQFLTYFLWSNHNWH